jgi:transcriptional regulator with XRE-family HTH domain
LRWRVRRGREPRFVPGCPSENRFLALRMRSKLSPRDVQAVTGIDPDHLEAAELGEEGLTHKKIKALAKLYKVWAYELFQEHTGGEDAWRDGRYWIRQ